MAKHLLSICLPTNGVAKWVIPSVRNLYAFGADESLFEVVVADNGGDNSDLAEPIKEFESHPNFHYYKTKAEGFYNIIENFLLANGDYMIKLNHRCILHEGMIEYIYNQAEKYYDRKPLLFFVNGHKGITDIREYDSFDGFLGDLSYYSSLSEGLFFWKEDLLHVSSIKFAPMSPNVSLMFDSRHKNLFVLDGTVIAHQQDETGKYGYNLFDTFAVLYLDLINEVRIDGSITKDTFIQIKSDLYGFLFDCYKKMMCNGAYENYSLDGMKESLSVYYSKWDYYYMVFMVKWFIKPKLFLQKCKRKLLRALRQKQKLNNESNS